jgi:hypothetical protein
VSNTEHPIQPIVIDAYGVERFKANAIVAHLANGRLNELATMDFSDEDWQQLAQLIGYSFSGWGGLSYVTDEAYERAVAAKEAALNALAPLRDAPAGEPDTSCVICPACTHQFRAIPVDIQQLMLGAGFEPPFTASPPLSAQPAAEPVAKE